MRKIGVFFSIFSVALLLLLSGCAKDDTQITGNVTYVAHSDGKEYIADGATVYLMIAGSETDYELKVTANSDGDYTFYPVPDGDYYIEAEYTYLLDNYTGKTAEFSAKGKDDLLFNIKMD